MLLVLVVIQDSPDQMDAAYQTLQTLALACDYSMQIQVTGGRSMDTWLWLLSVFEHPCPGFWN